MYYVDFLVFATHAEGESHLAFDNLVIDGLLLHNKRILGDSEPCRLAKTEYIYQNRPVQMA